MHGLVHCRTEQEAETLKVELQARLADCRLEMHPTKTKIVCCQDVKRKGKYPNTKFDFLGYCFRPRLTSTRNGKLFWGFNPAVSDSALNDMRAAIRDLELLRKTHLPLEEIARQVNPLLRGWIAYYGRYNPSALGPLFGYVNQRILVWMRRKFKSLSARKVRAAYLFRRLSTECACLRALADRRELGVRLMGAE
jgi:RNA-directed DNA polymerase